MNKFRKIVIIIYVFGVTNSGCGQSRGEVERKALPSPNSISHVFELPIETLRDTIVTLFEVMQQVDNPYLKNVFYYYIEKSEEPERVHQVIFNAETATHPSYSFVEGYFKSPGTRNDVYVHANGDTWLSPQYHVNGKPLEYRTPFILKLMSVDEGHTRLSVVAENPVVLNGTECCSPHGFYAREEKVPPSTIEEHALLLFIADKLGDKTVEHLKMPAPEQGKQHTTAASKNKG